MGTVAALEARLCLTHRTGTAAAAAIVRTRRLLPAAGREAAATNSFAFDRRLGLDRCVFFAAGHVVVDDSYRFGARAGAALRLTPAARARLTALPDARMTTIDLADALKAFRCTARDVRDAREPWRDAVSAWRRGVRPAAEVVAVLEDAAAAAPGGAAAHARWLGRYMSARGFDSILPEAEDALRRHALPPPVPEVLVPGPLNLLPGEIAEVAAFGPAVPPDLAAACAEAGVPVRAWPVADRPAAALALDLARWAGLCETAAPLVARLDRLAFVQACLDHYALSPGGIHGPGHWFRVESLGHALAVHEPAADADLITLFAFLHDCARRTERGDPEHGPRAAELAAAMNGGPFSASVEGLALLSEACRIHSRANAAPSHGAVAACLDADRLDLWRLDIAPDPRRLFTATARREDVREAARAFRESHPTAGHFLAR